MSDGALPAGRVMALGPFRLVFRDVFYGRFRDCLVLALPGVRLTRCTFERCLFVFGQFRFAAKHCTHCRFDECS
jgi:hypothetical protein